MRKIFCETLISNVGKPIHNACIVLSENQIISEIVPNALSENCDEVFSGIICPGFVNVHCHLELSHLKGKIETNLGMVGFIKAIQNVRQANETEILEAAEIADERMYKEGVDFVGDICNSSITKSIKEKSKLQYHSFVEAFGFIPEKAKSIFENALQLKKTFGKNASITAHAPYSVSKELFQLIQQENPELYSIHNQESEAENLFYLKKEGDFINLYEHFGMDISFFKSTQKKSFESYKSFLPNGKKSLLVHNTYSDKSDLEQMKNSDAKIFLGICPNANMYIENTLPNIPMMREMGMKLCIGTDSLASNNQLSILEELKTIHKHFPEIPVEELIVYATKNGADFFGRADLGRIEIGKKSTLVHIENASLDGLDTNAKAFRLFESNK